MTGQKFKMTIIGIVAVMAWAVVEAILRKYGLEFSEWTVYIIPAIVAAFNVPQAFADAISKGATSTVATKGLNGSISELKDTITKTPEEREYRRPFYSGVSVPSYAVEVDKGGD